MNKEAKNELARQISHVLLGVLMIGALLLLWKTTHGWQFIAVFVAWIGFISLCTIMYLHSRGKKTPFGSLFEQMGKRDVFVGEGALWYVLGVLVALSFLGRFLYVISSIYILAVGDSISAIYSYKKRYTPNIFKGRNWLSMLAFIVLTSPVVFFIGAKAIPLIIICAVAEALDTKINDNFLIPLICVLYFLLF